MWEDLWIPDSMGFKPIPKSDEMLLRQGMMQSLKNDNGELNTTLLKELFSRQSMQDICRIFWASNDKKYMLIWVGNKNGEFSNKSFYWIENWESENQQIWWRNMWNNKIHERQKFLIQKIAHKGLSLKQNLVRRGIPINDTSCMHECSCVEDKVHVFFICQFAKGLWFTAPWGIRWRDQISYELNNYLKHIWSPETISSMIKHKHKGFILYSAIIIEHLWWVRNEICFKEAQVSLNDLVRIVRNRFNEYKHVFRKVDVFGELNHDNIAIREQNPPPKGIIKVNSDAAVRGANSFLELDREVIEARIFKISIADPLVAKFMAV